MSCKWAWAHEYKCPRRRAASAGASALSHWAISPTPMAGSFRHCIVGRVERKKYSSFFSARSSRVEVQGAASDRIDDSKITKKSRDPPGSHLALSWRRDGPGLTPEQVYPESLLLSMLFISWS